MNPEIWIALAAANFFSAVSPGQNVALVGSATARGGLAGGMAATGGILVAEIVWSISALLLVIGSREASPVLWNGLQMGSGLFLLVFGIRSWRAVTNSPAKAASTGARHGWIAIRGFWIGLANPITLIFFLSLFPVLVPSDIAQISPALIAFCASAIVISAAAGLAPYLAVSGLLARQGLGRVLERASSGALVLLGALVILRFFV